MLSLWPSTQSRLNSRTQTDAQLKGSMDARGGNCRTTTIDGTHTHTNTKHARTATEPEATTTEREIEMATTEPEMATTEPEEASATTERETATNPRTGNGKRQSPPRRLHCLSLWPSGSRAVPHTSRRNLRLTMSPERSPPTRSRRRHQSQLRHRPAVLL